MGVSALGSPSVLAGQQSIDQSQTTVLEALLSLQSGWAGQTFLQAGDNISGAGVYVLGGEGPVSSPGGDGNPYDAEPDEGTSGGAPRPGGTINGQIHYELWTGLPFGAASGETLLLSGIAGFTFNQKGWVDIFWTPILLASDKRLFFAVYAPDAALYTSFAGNGYAAGTAFHEDDTNSVGSWSILERYGSFGDMTFRTYTTALPATTVPEPLTLLLLGTGLAGVAGIGALRRRRLARAP